MTGAADAFSMAVSRLPAQPSGHHPAWLEGLRRSALQWVSERGFPTAKDEAWKYTRVAPILEIPFEPAEPGTSQRLSVGAVDRLAGHFGGPRLVFVNGHFSADLSSLKRLPQGARVMSLAAVLVDDGEVVEPFLSRWLHEDLHAFTALNAALAEDGAVVRLPPNTTVEAPIHLVFLSDPGAVSQVSLPRSLVLVGAGSRATIIETYAGILGDVYLTNAVTEVVLDERATVEHYKVQNETEAAFHIAHLSVRQQRDSRFSTHSVSLGSSLARHEVKVSLEGPGAEVVLNGLYLPQGKQHLDNVTTIEHSAPYCKSREVYRGIVDGQGRGVFDGRIVVRPGAMKTDASQTNKVLLLSESAEADTRPRLEIFADDVKCAHGATVGHLDQEAVFYLRSRGIPENAARGLLCQAFAGEMLGLIQVKPLRAQVERLVASRLGTDSGGMAT